MNVTIPKTLAISMSVIVVLFLLLDGGTMTQEAIRHGMAENGGMNGRSLIWLIPTLLIFGFGFAVAWLVLGRDDLQQTEFKSSLDEPRVLSNQENPGYWERLDDPLCPIALTPETNIRTLPVIHSPLRRLT